MSDYQIIILSVKQAAAHPDSQKKFDEMVRSMDLLRAEAFIERAGKLGYIAACLPVILKAWNDNWDDRTERHRNATLALALARGLSPQPLRKRSGEAVDVRLMQYKD